MTTTQVPQAMTPAHSTLPEVRPLGTSRNRRADALAAAGWISTAFAVTLYLADGGLHSFSSVGTMLNAAGIVAGLVATNAMLLMLLLAARVPLIDNTIGQVKANEWHRDLGNLVVCGVFAHAGLLLAGYAYSARESVIAMFAELWAGSFDFVLAVAGLVLLIVIAVTSIAAARRHFAYEVWHAIHLLSYLAVGVSIPHMFSMGSMLLPGQWQRIYWATLLVAVGFALTWWRVITPIYRSLRHNLRVANITRISADTYNIAFSGRDLDKLDARAGQYFNWRFFAKGIWAQAHPLSLSAAPDGRSLRVTARVAGKGTASMVKAPIGTRVAVAGPYGVFTDAARTRDALVLVGAGTGVAPIRALLESTTAPPQRTTVILRASNPDEVLLLDEFYRVCRQRGVTLHVMVGPRHDGRWVPASYARHTLTTLVPYAKQADVFVCGPDAFIEKVLEEARTAGLTDEQLHEERFSW